MWTWAVSRGSDRWEESTDKRFPDPLRLFVIYNLLAFEITNIKDIGYLVGLRRYLGDRDVEAQMKKGVGDPV